MGGRLDGKITIITGGSQGLGREIALAYAEEGADVVLAARGLSEMEAVAKEIRDFGRRVLTVPTDIRQEEQVNQMVHSVVEEFGQIDILVNSAGSGAGFGTLWETSIEQFQFVLDIYLTGTFRCIKAVIPQMKDQNGGVIVNLSSWVGQRDEYPVDFGPYAIAKWGVEGLTQLLAAELAEYGIRVNTIRPGGPSATQPVLGDLTKKRVEMLKQLRHGPVVRPDIIRPVALFLASDQSTGVSGQSLNAKSWNIEHGHGDVTQYLYDF